MISSTLSDTEGYYPNPKISSTIFCQGKWYFLFSCIAAHTTDNVHFTPCLCAWKVLGVGVFHGFVCVGVFFLISDTTAHLKKHTVAECLTQKLNSRVMLFSVWCLFMCLVVPFQVPCALLVQEIFPSSAARRHLHEAVHSQLELKYQETTQWKHRQEAA